MITLESAVQLVREVEPLLAAVGQHVALTGSTIFKGESAKDIDLIIYPNDPKKTKSPEEISAMLVSNGWELVRASNPEYTIREIYVMRKAGVRVDIFFLT